ncbi:MAG: flp pilus-assembly TadE/G-like family protein [Actinomycetota bacterium]|nr:flp pilus-assembly TadE/G-like family protein [Actinomycetota bacterium]
MTPRERGNGTVLSLGFMFMIAVAGFLVLAQVQAVMKTHAVQGAADLSAIAAAQTPGDSCAGARAIAAANQVRLVDCRTEGTDFIVRVESDLPSLVMAVLKFVHVQSAPIQASARAGPVESLPSRESDGVGLD